MPAFLLQLIAKLYPFMGNDMEVSFRPLYVYIYIYSYPFEHNLDLSTIGRVEPVLNDHTLAKRKVVLNRGGLLIEVKMHGKAT